MDRTAGYPVKLTLPAFAESKGFKAVALAAYGVRATKDGKVIIPYLDRSGNEYIRYRIRSSSDDGKGFAWSRGDAPLIPYGLNRPVPYTKGFVWVVEGESDCWALWSHEIPALGIPGATNMGCVRATYFDGVETVAVVQEPGEAGSRFPHAVAQRLYDEGFAGQVFAVTLPAKDPRELMAAEPEKFREALAAAFKGRRPIERPKMVEPAILSGGTISAAEFLNMAEEDVDWLVDGLIPRGGIGLLSAKPKAGKSLFARNMALAIARGSSFLGRRCAGGAVLWVALEEPRGLLLSSFRAMGLQAQDPIRFHLGAAPERAFAWLEQECNLHDIALVVLDTWHKMTRIENINDYAAVNLANEPLMRLARSKGVAQLWVHHSNKGEHANGDQVLGSSALFAAADVLISIRRSGDGVRTASSIQRMGTDMEDLILTMDPNTERLSSAGSRYVVALAEAKERILAYLIGVAGSLVRDAIVKAVEGRTTLLRSALYALVADGQVLSEGSGSRGDPKRYRVSPTASLKYLVPESASRKGLRDPAFILSPEAGTNVDSQDQVDQADSPDLLMKYAQERLGE